MAGLLQSYLACEACKHLVLQNNRLQLRVFLVSRAVGKH